MVAEPLSLRDTLREYGMVYAFGNGPEGMQVSMTNIEPNKLSELQGGVSNVPG